jgi:hypothetical protein
MSRTTWLELLLAAGCLATGRPEALLATSALLALVALRLVARTTLHRESLHRESSGWSVPAGGGALAAAQWRQLLDPAGHGGSASAGRHRHGGDRGPAASGAVGPVPATVQGRQR